MDLDKIYQDKFGHHSCGDVKQLGWGSEQSQFSRFKVLFEIGVEDGDSVLDVGCGFGDMIRFSKENGLSIKYSGIDIRSAAIDGAKLKHPDNNFYLSNITDFEENHKWILGSGVFGFNCDDWENVTRNILVKMYNICLSGVAVNFLSDLTPFNRDSQMKHVYPCCIMKMASDISKKFVIRHDYKANDFCLYLYK